MSTTPTMTQKLIYDLPLCGSLRGQFFVAAFHDLELQKILDACADRKFNPRCVVKNDDLPEDRVARYFAAHYADSRLDTFELSTPLPPAAPAPGENRAARIKAEVSRQWKNLMAARDCTYICAQLSDCPSWRTDVRVMQLATNPELQAKYSAALGLTPVTK
jgi:hypothetical protein